MGKRNKNIGMPDDDLPFELRNKYNNNNVIKWNESIKVHSDYSIYFNYFINIAENRFLWLDLPFNMKSRYIEKILCRNGRGLAFKIKDTDLFYFSRYNVNNNKVDFNGEPLEMTAYSYNGRARFKLNRRDVAICYNTMSFTGSDNVYTVADYYARQLANLDIAFNVNLKHQLRPLFITAPQEREKDVNNLLLQSMGGTPVVLGYSQLDDVKFDFLQPSVDYRCEEYINTKKRLIDECMTILGINVADTFRKTNTVDKELDYDNERTNLMKLNSLNARKEFADEFNFIFKKYLHKPIKVITNENFVNELYEYDIFPDKDVIKNEI